MSRPRVLRIARSEPEHSIVQIFRQIPDKPEGVLPYLGPRPGQLTHTCTYKSGAPKFLDAPPALPTPADLGQPERRSSLLRRANPAVATDGDDPEVIATVELVTRFRHRGLAANRTLFAIADEVEPAGIDATICQVLSRGSRTALSESQVVFIRATVVRVAFDPDPHA